MMNPTDGKHFLKRISEGQVYVGALNASFFTAHDTSNMLYIVLIYLSALFYGKTPVPQYPFYV